MKKHNFFITLIVKENHAKQNEIYSFCPENLKKLNKIIKSFPKGYEFKIEIKDTPF